MFLLLKITTNFPESWSQNWLDILSKRRNPGRNNQNAGKLIEKYTELAREALSNGDKILSENYLQHADHFSRIINIQQQQSH